MKLLAGVIVLLLLSACGPSVTESDLEPLVAPIVQSQDLLENFENQVNAGLTYGAMLSEWPAVDVGDFLRDDGTESAVTASYRLAGVSMANLDELRAAAETPGAALSTTTAS